MVTACAAVRRLPQYIGEEEGPITRFIARTAETLATNKTVIEDAAEAAGTKIHNATVHLFGEEGSERARSAFTELTCQTIGRYVQTGTWPSDVDTGTDAFNAVRAEVQPQFSVSEIGSSVVSVAQSMWTGKPTDDEAVRGVVCAAVGVTV
jgi:hypothetical protein